MRNAELALHFDELADLYELDGAIVHRVLAYRNAAKAIRESGVSVEELARQGRADQVQLTEMLSRSSARRNASITSRENCLPAQRSSSSRALSGPIAIR